MWSSLLELSIHVLLRFWFQSFHLKNTILTSIRISVGKARLLDWPLSYRCLLDFRSFWQCNNFRYQSNYFSEKLVMKGQSKEKSMVTSSFSLLYYLCSFPSFCPPHQLSSELLWYYAVSLLEVFPSLIQSLCLKGY